MATPGAQTQDSGAGADGVIRPHRAAITSASDGRNDAVCPEPGQRLRRALALRGALKLGLNVSLDEIAADELQAMPILEVEQAGLNEEKFSVRGD